MCVPVARTQNRRIDYGLGLGEMRSILAPNYYGTRLQLINKIQKMDKQFHLIRPKYIIQSGISPSQFSLTLINMNFIISLPFSFNLL